jgi:hypothetical protein
LHILLWAGHGPESSLIDVSKLFTSSNSTIAAVASAIFSPMFSKSSRSIAENTSSINGRNGERRQPASRPRRRAAPAGHPS